MPDSGRTLEVLDGAFAIHRFPPGMDIPSEVLRGEFFTVSRTQDELSILCRADVPLRSPTAETGWCGFRFEGALDFSEIGILAGLAGVLADAGISIFAVSTYDTDYIFLKEDEFSAAKAALQQSGYVFTG